MESSKDDLTMNSKTKILSEMDQERYECVITEVNGKINDLFDDVKNVDKTQVEVNKKVQEVEENNLNYLRGLRKIVNQCDENITKLNNHLSKAKDDQIARTEVASSLVDLEKQYNEIAEKITKQIVRIEKELNELVFSYDKTVDLSTKIVEHKDLMELGERQHKEKIALLKRYFVIQQDVLNDVIEEKLKYVSSKFEDQYKICTAGYSERKFNELKEKEASEKAITDRDEEALADEKDISDGKDLVDETDIE